MAVGIGIDSVSISELERLVARSDARARRTFTPAERAQAETRHDAASYLAGRFAVKEAVAKALYPHVGTGFDFRAVETVDQADGRPQVTIDDALRKTLASCRATEILVSITNEAGLATAVALVQ